MSSRLRILSFAFFVLFFSAALVAQPVPCSLEDAMGSDTDAAPRELTTRQLRQVLVSVGPILLDTRPYEEYALSHIPGALNLATKPGAPASQHVSSVQEVDRLVGDNKAAPLVLYCNAPLCGLARELQEAGYTNVREYQLGIPAWRALAGVTQVEADGVRRIYRSDQRAVFVDAREPADFLAGTIRRAVNLPYSGLRPGKDPAELTAAKDDGRLPMKDHHARIVVFGASAAQARAVGEALARRAFHNVSFFAGSADQLRRAVEH